MAAPSLKRAYSGKDVDMLTACGTIIEQAIVHKTFLITKRANWADPFLPDLITRIDNAFTNFLGIDNALEMREATQIVLGIQANAMPDLALFKVQIVEDFKNNKPHRDEILIRLGFTQHLKDAQNNDQEGLVELLLKFKKNMKVPLQTEITNAGMSAALITAIIAYADALKNANITQETLKGSRKVISQAAVTEFNAIYNAVISIAKISAKFFINDLAIRDKFSYSKTLSNINQPPTGPAKIIGTVTDTANNPLLQASLKINGLNLLVQTDINGEYDFLQPISPGTYTVTCTKDGFQDQTTPPFTLSAGQTHTQNFQLSPL